MRELMTQTQINANTNIDSSGESEAMRPSPGGHVIIGVSETPTSDGDSIRTSLSVVRVVRTARIASQTSSTPSTYVSVRTFLISVCPSQFQPVTADSPACVGCVI